MNQLNYHHLYYFYVTATEGSVTKAAERLHVTSQTVSGQIAAFETSLGFRLFDRKSKRLRLNAQGQLAYDFAKQIFSMGQNLVESLQAHQKGYLARFSIGITDVVPKVLAFDVMRPIIEQQPTTRFVFREGSIESLLGGIATNKVDIIISDRAIAANSAVKAHSQLLGESGVSFFAAPKIADALTKRFPLCLSQQAFILPGDNSRLKRNLEMWFEAINIEVDVIAEFDDSALLKLFGSDGLGVFAAPSSVEGHVEQQYGVACIGRTNDITERFYAITAEGRMHDNLVADIMISAKKVMAQ